MSTLLLVLLSSLRSSLYSRAALQAEILALRHQLLVLQRSTQDRRVRFHAIDRVFWVWLSRLWQGWRSHVRIMKADTVITWNRKGFRLYWTWKSRAHKGRPCKPREIRDSHTKNEFDQPRLGCSPHSWRTPEARHQHRRNHSRQVHGASPKALFANLEDIPEEPHAGVGFYRLLCGTDGNIP